MSQSRVLLINTNAMKPPVAPVALDYLAAALTQAGHAVEIADLCFAEDVEAALRQALAGPEPRVVGLTFRNSDDCFWPSGKSFLPRLRAIVRSVRRQTAAPVVVGGAGFSVFPEAILEISGAEMGVVGDGEEALTALLPALDRGDLGRVPGLVWQAAGRFVRNPPSRPDPVRSGAARAWVDNSRYFREGGQMGVETKRGCDQRCLYCADIHSKGARVRVRPPEDAAVEMENLLRQGIDVLHLCDAEFNVPPEHAMAVCREMIRRGIGARLRWYAYATVSGFPADLARAMRQAGCAGINFGVDSAHPGMLAAYGRRHRAEDIAQAVRFCRAEGIRVMLDLLLGGPGETESTLRETIEFMRRIEPDCVGAALGVRVYPGTPFAAQVEREGPLESHPCLRRIAPPPGLPPSKERLLWPVFYVSRALGDAPAQLVRRLIAGDERFFEPMDEQGPENYNYNDNQPLVEAIRGGARGAYWDILSRMRAAARCRNRPQPV